MYVSILTIHNILRWGVLLAGLYAITKAALGVINKRDFTKTDNISQAIFVGFCHAQLLIGLILYFISPRVSEALANGMGAAMKNADARFMAVEHISTMVIGIVLIQVGRTLSKKQTVALAKHKKALVFFSIGFVLILSRIPWDKVLWPM
ncbi:MAG: hypothetical protein KBE91_12420 [Bacteroidia bacterium]|nr:hypothetical protein [Bacteroidia bacterium]